MCEQEPIGLWENNEIQFARLLCEIRANCEMEGFDQVMESMDIDDELADELFRRAESVWEASKRRFCPTPNQVLDQKQELDDIKRKLKYLKKDVVDKLDAIKSDTNRAVQVVEGLAQRRR